MSGGQETATANEYHTDNVTSDEVVKADNRQEVSVCVRRSRRLRMMPKVDYCETAKRRRRIVCFRLVDFAEQTYFAVPGQSRRLSKPPQQRVSVGLSRVGGSCLTSRRSASGVGDREILRPVEGLVNEYVPSDEVVKGQEVSNVSRVPRSCLLAGRSESFVGDREILVPIDGSDAPVARLPLGNSA